MFFTKITNAKCMQKCHDLVILILRLIKWHLSFFFIEFLVKGMSLLKAEKYI